MLIEVDIRSFWRAGTGEGEAGDIDALCALDHEGLPFLPGRHLKGLLREALRQAIRLGRVEKISDQELFGTGEKLFSEQNGRSITEHARTDPGKLRVDSARLPKTDRTAISQNPDLREHLFRTLQSTEIDSETGAAKNRSLRLEQVAVPLKLEFQVTAVAKAPDDWEVKLREALPLIRAVGQKRTRGLGRAVLRCIE